MDIGRTLAGVARQLNRRHDRENRLPPAILMTDEIRLPDPVAAAGNLPEGSGLVVRHYNDPGRWHLAETLRTVTARHRLCLLIAVRSRSDVRRAMALGADGVHVPENLAWRIPAYRTMASRMLVTAAAHGPVALRRASRHGADAALLSPVFPTASHPGRPAIGAARARQWVRQCPLPVYGLGGINPSNVRRLMDSGFVGIAAIDGLRTDK